MLLPKNSLLCPHIRFVVFISTLLMMVLNCESAKKWTPPKTTPYPADLSEKSLNLLISGLGLKKETYRVTTKDGYILCLTRVVLPEKENKKDKGIPMLMVNGLGLHSDAWLLHSNPNHNPAIHWLTHGYDVWLGDQRGSMRSRRHKKYDYKKDYKYWNFTFHETGIYDLPAFIDFILRKTKKQKLCYSGLSVGTTFAFVLLSEKPKYNDKIYVAIQFAPVGDVPLLSTRSLATQVTFNLLITLGSYYHVASCGAAFLDALGFKEHLLGLCLTAPPLFVLATVPGLSIDVRYICPQVAFQFGGTSVDAVLHTLQLFKNGEFRKYDYGEKGNRKNYGSAEPPFYNYSRITAPMAFYYGDMDEYSSAVVVKRMIKKLGGTVYSCITKNAHHSEVLTGTNFGPKYNSDILAVLDSATGRTNIKKLHSKMCRL